MANINMTVRFDWRLCFMAEFHLADQNNALVNGFDCAALGPSSPPHDSFIAYSWGCLRRDWFHGRVDKECP